MPTSAPASFIRTDPCSSQLQALDVDLPSRTHKHSGPSFPVPQSTISPTAINSTNEYQDLRNLRNIDASWAGVGQISTTFDNWRDFIANYEDTDQNTAIDMPKSYKDESAVERIVDQNVSEEELPNYLNIAQKLQTEGEYVDYLTSELQKLREAEDPHKKTWKELVCKMFEEPRQEIDKKYALGWLNGEFGSEFSVPLHNGTPMKEDESYSTVEVPKPLECVPTADTGYRSKINNASFPRLGTISKASTADTVEASKCTPIEQPRNQGVIMSNVGNQIIMNGQLQNPGMNIQWVPAPSQPGTTFDQESLYTYNYFPVDYMPMTNVMDPYATNALQYETGPVGGPLQLAYMQGTIQQNIGYESMATHQHGLHMYNQNMAMGSTSSQIRPAPFTVPSSNKISGQQQRRPTSTTSRARGVNYKSTTEH